MQLILTILALLSILKLWEKHIGGAIMKRVLVRLKVHCSNPTCRGRHVRCSKAWWCELTGSSNTPSLERCLFVAHVMKSGIRPLLYTSTCRQSPVEHYRSSRVTNTIKFHFLLQFHITTWRDLNVGGQIRDSKQKNKPPWFSPVCF